MGFFGKLTNWFRGKGFKESEQIKQEEEQLIRERNRQEELERSLREAENKVPIKEETEEKEIKERPEIKVDTKVKEQTREFDDAISQYKKKGFFKEYENKMDNTTVNTVNITPDRDIGKYKETYKQLLSSKAKLSDPEILDILVQNRDKLKHRFSAMLTITTNKGEVAANIVMEGILVEELGLADIYLPDGKETEYLSDEIEIFLNDYRERYGLINSQVKVFKEKCTLGQKSAQVDFA